MCVGRGDPVSAVGRGRDIKKLRLIFHEIIFWNTQIMPAITHRKNILLSEQIKLSEQTIECTLCEHSIVMNKKGNPDFIIL